MDGTIERQDMPQVSQGNGEQGRRVQQVHEEGRSAYLFVRFRCGHYLKSSNKNVEFLLREAESGVCFKCAGTDAYFKGCNE